MLINPRDNQGRAFAVVIALHIALHHKREDRPFLSNISSMEKDQILHLTPPPRRSRRSQLLKVVALLACVYVFASFCLK